jgi:hypothetical protein
MGECGVLYLIVFIKDVIPSFPSLNDEPSKRNEGDQGNDSTNNSSNDGTQVS